MLTESLRAVKSATLRKWRPWSKFTFYWRRKHRRSSAESSEVLQLGQVVGHVGSHAWWGSIKWCTVHLIKTAIQEIRCTSSSERWKLRIGMEDKPNWENCVIDRLCWSAVNLLGEDCQDFIQRHTQDWVVCLETESHCPVSTENTESFAHNPIHLSQSLALSPHLQTWSS